MAKRFTRNIRSIKDIEKQPKETNEQNDLLSDEKNVYVRNQDKYEQITGGVKEVNGETPDENGHVNLQLKDFTGQEKFVRKNELDEALEDIDINDRNLLLNSSNPLARWKEYKGSNYSAKQVDMTEEWGTENAYEFSISGGTSSLKVLYGSEDYVSEPMVFDQEYTYSVFIKNTGKNKLDFSISGLIKTENSESQSIQIETGESKRLSFTGVRRHNYNWFQPRVSTRYNHPDDDLKVIMAMEKIQKGKPTGWTPAPEDYDAKIKRLEKAITNLGGEI